ncbi:uncharacterized protein BJX67DRAFT_381065 [Aspergillus lucknowensis]|uniref:Uncharacterized protein n=1 Tax=Aspergillus lucknowensis TaxID=176173 RepID=A0ABR4LS36_9EURO
MSPTVSRSLKRVREDAPEPEERPQTREEISPALKKRRTNQTATSRSSRVSKTSQASSGGPWEKVEDKRKNRVRKARPARKISGGSTRKSTKVAAPTLNKPKVIKVLTPRKHSRDSDERLRMSRGGYVKMANRLKEKKVTREVGKGTINDPWIVWVCDLGGLSQKRIEGCEKVCREACKLRDMRKCWIRAPDHATTQTFSEVDGARIIWPAEPHITVHFGKNTTYEFDAHVYCTYDPEDSSVPHALGRTEKLPYKDALLSCVDLRDRRPLLQAARDKGWL